MAQDWRVVSVIYFCSAGSDLFAAVLHRPLGLELADMTRKDIIRMAQEANVYCTTRQPTLDAMLERFAALVAAAEFAKRERNFCERCGKRTADLTTIHTCTPPQENT